MSDKEKCSGILEQCDCIDCIKKRIDNNCIEVYKILASPGKELAEISKIMACPAECPAISETDGYTVRAVKCFVQGFHLLEKQVNELRTRPATLDAEKVMELIKVAHQEVDERQRERFAQRMVDCDDGFAPMATKNMIIDAINDAIRTVKKHINSGNLGVGDI